LVVNVDFVLWRWGSRPAERETMTLGSATAIDKAGTRGLVGVADVPVFRFGRTLGQAAAGGIHGERQALALVLAKINGNCLTRDLRQIRIGDGLHFRVGGHRNQACDEHQTAGFKDVFHFAFLFYALYG
ncbi:MAG: hypothetical protein WBC62_02050, partial [Candidatus Macondimonas sp.]